MQRHHAKRGMPQLVRRRADARKGVQRAPLEDWYTRCAASAFEMRSMMEEPSRMHCASSNTNRHHWTWNSGDSQSPPENLCYASIVSRLVRTTSRLAKDRAVNSCTVGLRRGNEGALEGADAQICGRMPRQLHSPLVDENLGHDDQRARHPHRAQTALRPGERRAAVVVAAGAKAARRLGVGPRGEARVLDLGV